MARQRVTLGRGATGLPRYYMDVGWYRHPNFAGLDLASIGLFEAIIGYSHEHATDGRCPSNHEDLAAALGLRASEVRKSLRRLIDLGRLVDADAGLLCVVGYEDHNPTSDEIDAYTSTRSSAGSYGNHKRWHLERGISDPDCEHCASQTRRNSDRTSDPIGDRKAVANASHGMGWDGIGDATEPTSNALDDEPSRNSDTPSDPILDTLDAAAPHLAEARAAAQARA